MNRTYEIRFQSLSFEVFAVSVDLSAWDVASVTDVSYMFRSATSFAQPLCWDTKLPQDARTVGMFNDANGSASHGCGSAKKRHLQLRRR